MSRVQYTADVTTAIKETAGKEVREELLATIDTIGEKWSLLESLGLAKGLIRNYFVETPDAADKIIKSIDEAVRAEKDGVA